jgi:hypothetical protein
LWTSGAGLESAAQVRPEEIAVLRAVVPVQAADLVLGVEYSRRGVEDPVPPGFLREVGEDGLKDAAVDPHAADHLARGLLGGQPAAPHVTDQHPADISLVHS